MKDKPRRIQDIYQKLYAKFGPQNWWPAQTKFEVIVGAVLVQNTSWNNVEKAINNLRRANCLNPIALHKISIEELAILIKPAGFFNIKAKRLKNVLDFLFQNYAGDLSRMSEISVLQLRNELLGINGVGAETADSILLYALDKPSFVVDAYTRRLLSRHKLIGKNADYESIQKLFVQSLPVDIRQYNEYHALIVELNKKHCRSQPVCEGCPLIDECAYFMELSAIKKERILKKSRISSLKGKNTL